MSQDPMLKELASAQHTSIDQSVGLSGVLRQKRYKDEAGRLVFEYTIRASGRLHEIRKAYCLRGKVVYFQNYRGYVITITGIGVAGALGWSVAVLRKDGYPTGIYTDFVSSTRWAFIYAREAIDRMLGGRVQHWKSLIKL